MRNILKTRGASLAAGLLAGTMIFSGGAIAANTVGSNDIKDGAVKKRDLSDGVKKSVDGKATDAELAATNATVAALSAKLDAAIARISELEKSQAGVDAGTGSANFAAGPGASVTATTATLTIATGGGTSVESPNLDVAVQAGDVISFAYALSNGATCSAGAPRVFVEIGGAFPNSWDQNQPAGTQCGTDGVVTFTAPTNGRIGQAGFVYDNGVAGTVVFSDLTIDGRAIPLA